MFGMLDYRAHKLYWLISLPLQFFILVISYALPVIATVISINYFDSLLMKFMGAVIGLEVGAIFVSLFFALLGYILKKVFLFFVDVMPSEGRDIEEAFTVVYVGELARLNFKLKYSPIEFDFDDEIKYGKILRNSQGWLVNLLRLFMGEEHSIFTATIRERFSALIERVKEIDDNEDREDFVNFGTVSFLEENNMAPSPIELNMVAWKHIIYKYILLLFTLYFLI